MKYIHIDIYIYLHIYMYTCRYICTYIYIQTYRSGAGERRTNTPTQLNLYAAD